MLEQSGTSQMSSSSPMANTLSNTARVAYSFSNSPQEVVPLTEANEGSDGLTLWPHTPGGNPHLQVAGKGDGLPLVNQRVDFLMVVDFFHMVAPSGLACFSGEALRHPFLHSDEDEKLDMVVVW